MIKKEYIKHYRIVLCFTKPYFFIFMVRIKHFHVKQCHFFRVQSHSISKCFQYDNWAQTLGITCSIKVNDIFSYLKDKETKKLISLLKTRAGYHTSVSLEYGRMQLWKMVRG